MRGRRRWDEADRLTPLQVAAAMLAAILLLAAFGLAGEADYECRVGHPTASAGIMNEFNCSLDTRLLWGCDGWPGRR